MKRNLYKPIKENIELVKEELLKIGCTSTGDHDVIYKTSSGEELWLIVTPEFLYPKNDTRQVWYAVTFQVSNDEKLKAYEYAEKYGYKLLNELKDIFKKSKYKFFYDEDALVGVFSHGQINNHGWISYSAYCNPEVPEGAWSNHALN